MIYNMRIKVLGPVGPWLLVRTAGPWTNPRTDPRTGLRTDLRTVPRTEPCADPRSFSVMEGGTEEEGNSRSWKVFWGENEHKLNILGRFDPDDGHWMQIISSWNIKAVPPHVAHNEKNTSPLLKMHSSPPCFYKPKRSSAWNNFKWFYHLNRILSSPLLGHYMCSPKPSLVFYCI